MKIVGKSFAALAAALLAFSSCNRVALPEIPAESHSISFVAKAPQTKTSATIDKDAKTVDYSWSEKDTERFTIYEIVGETYTAATSVSAILDDGTMMLEAEFGGTATPGAKYVALLNGGVQANQEASDTEYDQASDVLVSEVVTSENIEDEALLLSFKRETAFALMTAKNLEGEYVLGASVSADKNLAAEYDYKAGTFKEDGCKTVTVSDRDDDGNYDVISEIQGGQSTLFLATVPVDEASLTVGVVTADENGGFKAAYKKSFGTGKSISFTRGDVHAFGIGMNKVESLILDLSKDETTTASTDALTWERTFISVVAAKAGSATNANNYYPGTTGKSYSSTRFYTNSNLTFAPKIGLSIKEIIYSATTESYASVLANSTWTNATASALDKTVTIIPTDGTQAVSAVIGGTTGATAIVVKYGIPVQPTKYSITIDDGIEHGSVTADPSSDVMPGTEVALTATPEDGYVFSSWNVTNASTSEEITITDDKFTMPDADVNVSAAFKEIYALKTMDEIFAAATSAGATATDTKVTFNNWVVSGIKQPSNVYVTDGTKGLLIYASGHGFEVGDVLSGTVNCKVQLFNGSSELTNLTSATDGLKVTKGGVITPSKIDIANLGGVNTGAVITFESLTYTGTAFTDGTNEIKPYNTFISLPTLTSGRSYQVSGVYIQYKDTKEIAPRTKEDIIELSIPYLTASADKTSGIAATGETIFVTVDTNVEVWSVVSDNDAFTIKNQTKKGFEVEVSENTDTEKGREAEITVSADGVDDVVISLTQNKKTTGGDPVTKSVDLTAQGYTNGQEVKSVDIDNNVNVVFDKGTNSNAPKYYTSGTAVRCYGGNTISVKAAGKIITAIKLTFGSSDGSNAITTDVDSFTSPNWSGESETVVFTIGGTSGNRRITRIEVTYR